VRPIAKIVVEAETQSQMDDILLALSRAVERYGSSVKDYSNAASHAD
jgi:hypothetical protein